MIKNIVESYVSEHLIPQLEGYRLSHEQVQIISRDISSRLQSLLAIWHNQDYMTALFELVKEEALFYRPRCHISIRSFVVLGVRNSFIEDVHSSEPLNPELKTHENHFTRSSNFIRVVTEGAISFFSMRIQRGDDYSSIYQNTLFDRFDERFPRIWRVLSRKKLANLSDLTTVPDLADEIKSLDASDGEAIHAVQSGIDPRMNKGFLNQLKYLVENPDTLFFTPSFKHISRNPEKVLSVLDFLLFAGVPIVTPNYLFTSEKVFTRKSLLKPIHNNSELKKVLTNTSGIAKEHAQALRTTASSI